MRRLAPVLPIAILGGCGAGLAQAPYGVVQAFGGRPINPTGLIRASDGFYYGGTNEGGTSGGYGAVYRSDDAGTVTVIHSFAGTDGAYPRSPLARASRLAAAAATSAQRTPPRAARCLRSWVWRFKLQ